MAPSGGQLSTKTILDIEEQHHMNGLDIVMAVDPSLDNPPSWVDQNARFEEIHQKRRCELIEKLGKK